METLNLVLANLDVVLGVLLAILSLASLIVSGTRTPDPSSKLGKAYRVLEWLALTFGRAKETGKPSPASPTTPAAK